MPTVSVEPPVIEVSMASAAELLATPRLAVLLKPFMRADCTVAQAARELNLPVERLHYRVTRFVQAGLLSVVREEPRRGRPSKVYRAVGTHFRIPAPLLSERAVQALAEGQFWQREIRDQMNRHLQIAPLEAVTVKLNAKGALVYDTYAPAPVQERVSGILQLRSAAIFLDPEDADALARELVELHDRYQGKHGSKRYGLLLDLVPLDRPVDTATDVK